MFAEGFRTLAPAPMLCPMFIRRTRTRTGERGEVYYSHRLVRSERSGEKVRQRTLLNLGSDFPVERRHWAVLCSRIQQLLDRQAELVPLSCPEEVERHAQRIAAQLLNSAPSGGTGRPDLQTVDVGSLELIRPRSVGVEHVGLWAMERLGLEALLERLGFNGTQRALAMASVIARMAAPGSERASWRWLCERSALGELLGVDFERMSMMRLYRVSDALMAQRAAIEAQLFDRATDLFGLRSTVTLYDLTNTFFEGEAAAQSKARRGHSKEKRGDCPLLTLGLVLDGSGFVRRSEVFSGAVNEDKTLASMLEALGAPSDALVVMDAGIATEANIAWLRENGYRYLAVRELAALSTARGRLREQLGKIRHTTASVAKRSRKRLVKSVARSVVTAPAKALPYAGVAIVVGLTAWEIKDLCSTIRDMDEFQRAVGESKAETESEPIDCSRPDLAAKRAVAKMTSYSREAWEENRKYVPDLPDWEDVPDWWRDAWRSTVPDILRGTWDGMKRLFR